jgi:hypothetical protein
MRFKILFTSALLLGLAAPAVAQTEITPFVGAMLPMRSMLLDTAGSIGYRMQVQTIYGVRLTKPVSPSLGVELALGAGSGEFQIVSSTLFDLKTSVYFADLRARLRVAGDDDTQLALIAGAGWTQFTSGLFDAVHEGDPDTQLKGTATGMIGLGLKAKLGGRITLSVDALDRIHEQGIEAPGISGGLTELLQHDVTFSTGLAFPLGR